MNYRTMHFPNGSIFYTTWTLFEMTKEEAHRKSPIRMHLLAPEELAACVLNAQAGDLFNLIPAGRA